MCKVVFFSLTSCLQRSLQVWAHFYSLLMSVLAWFKIVNLKNEQSYPLWNYKKNRNGDILVKIKAFHFVQLVWYFLMTSYWSFHPDNSKLGWHYLSRYTFFFHCTNIKYWAYSAMVQHQSTLVFTQITDDLCMLYADQKNKDAVPASCLWKGNQ